MKIDLSKVVMETEPLIGKLVFNKKYVQPGGYGSIRKAQEFVAACMIEMRHISRKGMWEKFANTAPTLLSVLQLVKSGMPAYFVDKKIWEAVAHTKPPENFPLSELNFPAEGSLFILPESDFVFPEKNRVGFLIVSRIRRAEVFPMVPEITHPLMSGDIIIVSSGTFLDDYGVRSYHCHFPPSENYNHEALMEVDSLFTSATSVENISSEAMGVDDKDFSRRMFALALNLLLYMETGPEYLEAETIVRKGNPLSRKPKDMDDLWSPNFFGRSYRIRTERTDCDGTGVKVRPHIRRGHTRRQPYGPGNLLVKKIRIDPVWVNAE